METATGLRPIRYKPRPSAGRRRSPAQPPALRTAAVHSDAFLKHSFSPFWGITTGDWKRTEREFLHSLSNLCRLYGWEQPDISNLGFPLNIQAALHEMKSKLAATDMDCIIACDKKRCASLVTARTFHTGTTLYYIPVRPLWFLLKQGGSNILSDLLTGIFCYFYNVIGISFFNSHGYLCNTYDYLQNIIDDGEEEDEVYKELQQEELSTIRDAAQAIYQRLTKPFRLTDFSELLNDYRNTTGHNRVLIEFCEDFAEFAGDYPRRSIRQNIDSTVLLEGDADCIGYDQYLSFYWSGEDSFTDLLMDIVNADLQEISDMQQPLSLQWYDTPQAVESHSFHFETRLFSLLERLIKLLNDYDHEKHN